MSDILQKGYGRLQKYNHMAKPNTFGTMAFIITEHLEKCKWSGV